MIEPKDLKDIRVPSMYASYISDDFNFFDILWTGLHKKEKVFGCNTPYGGEISISYFQKENKFTIETGGMGKEFAKKVLCQLIDEAEEVE